MLDGPARQRCWHQGSTGSAAGQGFGNSCIYLGINIISLVCVDFNELMQQQRPQHTVAVSPLVGFGSLWSLSLFVPFPAACRDRVLLLPEQGPGLCWEKQLRVEIWRGRGGAGFCLPKGKRQSWECWLCFLSKGCSLRMSVTHME